MSDIEPLNTIVNDDNDKNLLSEEMNDDKSLVADEKGNINAELTFEKPICDTLENIPENKISSEIDVQIKDESSIEICETTDLLKSVDQQNSVITKNSDENKEDYSMKPITDIDTILGVPGEEIESESESENEEDDICKASDTDANVANIENLNADISAGVSMDVDADKASEENLKIECDFGLTATTNLDPKITDEESDIKLKMNVDLPVASSPEEVGSINVEVDKQGEKMDLIPEVSDNSFSLGVSGMVDENPLQSSDGSEISGGLILDENIGVGSTMGSQNDLIVDDKIGLSLPGLNEECSLAGNVGKDEGAVINVEKEKICEDIDLTLPESDVSSKISDVVKVEENMSIGGDSAISVGLSQDLKAGVELPQDISGCSIKEPEIGLTLPGLDVSGSLIGNIMIGCGADINDDNKNICEDVDLTLPASSISSELGVLKKVDENILSTDLSIGGDSGISVGLNQDLNSGFELPQDISTSFIKEPEVGLTLPGLDVSGSLTGNIEIGGGANINDENLNICEDVDLTLPASSISSELGGLGKVDENILSTDMSIGDENGNSNNSNLDLKVEVELPREKNMGLTDESEIELNLPEFDVSGGASENIEIGKICEDFDLASQSPDIGISGSLNANLNFGVELPQVKSSETEAMKNHEVTVGVPKISLNLSPKGFDSMEKKMNVLQPKIGVNIAENERNKAPESRIQTKLKNPDIHVLVDMDEINKTAVFTIEMSGNWNKEVIGQNGEHCCLNTKSDLNDDLYDENISRKREKLNIEMGLYIGKERLGDSTIYVHINSKNVVDCKVEESVFPSILNPSKEESIPETRPKRYDFRYQLPKIEFPLFGSKSISIEGSDNAEGAVRPEVDVTLPEDKAIIDERPKRYDFRFQLPKLDFLLDGDEKSSNVEVIDRNTADNNETIEIKNDVSVEPIITSTPKRFDFRYQLPKIDLSLFDSDDSSGKVVEDGDSEIRKPDFSTSIVDKVPDSKVDIKVVDRNVDYEFHHPKKEIVNLVGKENPNAVTNVQIDVHLDDQYPEVDVNIDDPTRANDFTINVSEMKSPSLDGKRRSNAYSDVDLKSNKPIFGSDVSGNDQDNENPTKRYDFRFQLPKIELPSLVWKANSHNAISDIDIDTNTSYINADLEVDSDLSADGHPKRYDFRYKLPSIDIPLFGSKSPNSEVGISEANINIDNANSEINADTTSNTGQENVSPTKRFDFRFKLPKIDLFTSTDDSDKIEEENILKLPNKELESDFDNRRYNFSFSLPETKCPSSEDGVILPEQNGDIREYNNQFLLIFDGGDSSKTDLFEITVDSGLLRCKERYQGEWQPQMTSTIKFQSPNKNELVVILPIRGKAKLLVLFNDQLLVKYNLKGCINILQSFNVNGAVKLNSVTLCDE